MYGSQTFNRHEKCIQEKMFPLIVNYGFGFFDDWLLPCHVFVDIHDYCMKPNDFLSYRDRILLKHLAITSYKLFMNSFVSNKSKQFVQLAMKQMSSNSSNWTDLENIKRDLEVIIHVHFSIHIFIIILNY